MKTIEYRTIDKSGWEPGLWQKEPDKRQWLDESTGLPCLAVRHESMGHWCGYVGVSKDHPWHGIGYNQPTGAPCGEYCGDDYHSSCTPEGMISVHGGITFSEGCAHGDDESKGICHKPGHGEPDDVWWFGFDCCHGGDLSPSIRGRRISFASATYKTLAYVEQECRQLATQINAAR